jgi:hypothetical protein
VFSGFRSQSYEEFYDVDERTDCWLSDGDYIGIGKGDMFHDDSYHGCGFSVRFLKN